MRETRLEKGLGLWSVLVRCFVSKEEDDHVSFSSLILSLCCGTVGSGLYGRAGLSSGSADRSSHQPLARAIVRSQTPVFSVRIRTKNTCTNTVMYTRAPLWHTFIHAMRAEKCWQMDRHFKRATLRPSRATLSRGLTRTRVSGPKNVVRRQAS